MEDREFLEEELTDKRVWAALGYIVFFVPLIFDKKSKLGKYCANQGLILAIVMVIVALLFGILSGIPLIGWLFRVCGGLADLALFCVGLLGFAQLMSVKRVMTLPFLGMLRLLPGMEED